MDQPDFDRIRAATDLLSGISDDARLLHMQNLVLNNGGVWSIPPKDTEQLPVLLEVHLFGVSAFSNDIETLPNNWMQAASNTLRAAITPDATNLKAI